jgi:hypothetical protein
MPKQLSSRRREVRGLRSRAVRFRILVFSSGKKVQLPFSSRKFRNSRLDRDQALW